MSAESLPMCESVERAILGSVLLDGEIMHSIRTSINTEDFALDKHRRIWRTMIQIYESGRAVDAVILMAELREIKQLETIGISYLAELQEGLPRLPSLNSYIERLKDKSLLRRLAEIAHKAELECLLGTNNGQTIRESLFRAVAELSEFSAEQDKPISTRELIDKHGIEELLNPRKEEGIRYPWTSLGRYVSDMHAGQMIVIGAYTGKGKTSAALQIAAHATAQGKSVLYWTMEMHPKALFRRLVCQSTGGGKSKTPRYEERQACVWLHENPIWFDAHSRTIPGFAASIRHQSTKSKIGLAIVDHLQLVNYSGRKESRTRDVGENSRSIKLAAMDFEIPFVVLSQFSRPGVDKPATIHSLKESGDIENDADVVLLINSPKGDGDSEIACEMNIAKQREGPKDITIPLLFRPTSQSFHSAENL